MAGRSFNARAVFKFRLDRLYRVYCLPGELRLIRIAGQNWGFAEALESQVGLKKLPARMRRQRLDEQRAAALEADTSDSESLLRSNPQNLRILRHEVRASKLLPPGFPIHGPHFGRWQIALGDGSRLRLQFEDPADLTTALAQLPEVLGDDLWIDPATRD